MQFVSLSSFKLCYLNICMSYTLRLVEFRSMKYRGPLELRVENQIICYKCGECLRVPNFTGFCDIILAGISATMRHSAEILV